MAQLEHCQCCYVYDSGKQCPEMDDLFEYTYGLTVDDYTISCKEHLANMGYDGIHGEVWPHKCERCRPKPEKITPLYMLIDCGDHFETRRKI